MAATGAAPGEAGEGRLAAVGRLEAVGWPEAGERRDWHTGLEPDSYEEEESARGLLDGNAARAG
jgi:hypothetical protein